MNIRKQAGGYVVPSYRAPEDTPWYHFLHGNVPGHQIDFMYRPEVPQGQLSRQHFSHLSRLMKYIEPQTNGLYAFAIGNLSRDDTQYEPGHGGVALIFGLRIRGVTDHAGRQDPPFAHGIAAIDRALDETTLFAAATLFHRRVLGAAEAADWYRTYVRCATDSPADVEHVLSGYTASFDDLPHPGWSSLSTRWITGGAPQPRRIAVVHEDGAPFEVIARCAARIAAMLYRSDIRWTSISNGREADLPNGVSIRFLAERDASPGDATDNIRRIRDVPEEEAEIAHQLFGARAAEREVQPVLGWRELYASNAPGTFDPEAALLAAPPLTAAAGEPARRSEPGSSADDGAVTQVWEGRPAESTAETMGDLEILVEMEVVGPSLAPTPDVQEPRAPMRRWTLMAVAVVGVLVAVLYLVFINEPPPGPNVPRSSSVAPPDLASVRNEPSPAPTATSSAAPPDSGAPPATSSTPAVKSAAPIYAESPDPAGKSGGRTRGSSRIFDAPLKLRKAH
jgi:hypothetical protein